jgi:hypothetical protein
MEFFRLELEGIWQFENLEEQNNTFFFLSSSTSLSLFLFFFFFFFFFFFLDQRLAFENNEIRFRNN